MLTVKAISTFKNPLPARFQISLEYSLKSGEEEKLRCSSIKCAGTSGSFLLQNADNFVRSDLNQFTHVFRLSIFPFITIMIFISLRRIIRTITPGPGFGILNLLNLHLTEKILNSLRRIMFCLRKHLRNTQLITQFFNETSLFFGGAGMIFLKCLIRELHQTQRFNASWAESPTRLVSPQALISVVPTVYLLIPSFKIFKAALRSRSISKSQNEHL